MIFVLALPLFAFAEGKPLKISDLEPYFSNVLPTEIELGFLILNEMGISREVKLTCKSEKFEQVFTVEPNETLYVYYASEYSYDELFHLRFSKNGVKRKGLLSSGVIHIDIDRNMLTGIVSDTTFIPIERKFNSPKTIVELTGISPGSVFDLELLPSN